MIYLFSSAGRAALHEFVSYSTLHAFDLDGTLAPIVADPGGISIQDELRQRLIRLDATAPVAVITGRARTDAVTHLGFRPGLLVGNHGAEGLPGQESNGQEFIRICRGWKEQLALLLPKMPADGMVLEDKGETLALHYRNAGDPVSARESIRAAIDRLSPAPRTVSGIFVENLAPRSAPNKGTALQALMELGNFQRAIFVGDDITDEDVFRLKNRAILGIRIGEDRQSDAAYYLREQAEMLQLLREMIALLDRRD